MLNDRSNAELAVAQTADLPIVAAKYFTNFGGYDLQLLAGSYKKQFTAGMGWAGGIGSFGFKGEGQFYAAGQDNPAQIILNLSADRLFKGNLYLASGILYNQRGMSKPPETWSGKVFSVTPQRLMPGKWTFILSGTKEFTPLFRGTLHIIHSPGIRLLMFYPALQYNWKANLDFDFIIQSFQIPVGGSSLKEHDFFLRLKWSF